MCKASIRIREEIAKFRKKTNLTEVPSFSLDIKDLEKTINEQANELIKREKTIDALQRNFESLSDFCKSEKLRTHNLTLQVESLTKDNEYLTMKIQELSNNKSQLPKQVIKEKNIDFDILKDTNSSLLRNIQTKKMEIEKLEDSLRNVKIERERLNKEVGSLKEKLGMKEKKQKEMEHEIQVNKEKVADLTAKVQGRDNLIEEYGNERIKLKQSIANMTESIKIKEIHIKVLLI